MSVLLTDLDGVCFDIDGTFYPIATLHRAMVLTAITSPILSSRFRTFRKAVRLEQEHIVTVPETLEGFRLRQAKSLARAHASDEDVKKMLEKIEVRLYDRWKKQLAHPKPYDGIKDVLVLIRDAGLKVGVLSDFPVGKKLEGLGIEDLVDASACSEESGYLKPHTAAFELILKRTELVEPHRVLYVGDSYAKDVAGASRAGMKTCLLAPKYEKAEHYPLADIVVGSWQELAARLQGR